MQNINFVRKILSFSELVLLKKCKDLIFIINKNIVHKNTNETNSKLR